jgi:hypothetical protein
VILGGSQEALQIVLEHRDSRMYQEEGTLKNWIKMFPAPISVVYGNVF